MSDGISGFSTAINLVMIRRAFKYAEENFTKEQNLQLQKNFKCIARNSFMLAIIMVIIIVPCILMSPIIRNNQLNKLYNQYNATHIQYVIRIDDNNVSYTRGESYYYDISQLGISLNDEKFKNHNTFVGLMNDNNELKGLISMDEYDQKITYKLAIPLILALIIPCTIGIIYATMDAGLYKIKSTRLWRKYFKWFEKDCGKKSNFTF